MPAEVWLNKLTSADLEEYRGVSYAIGGDRGSVTIPRILRRWTKPHGQSLGNHPPLAWPHASCQHLPEDALNAAVSGAVSLNLPQQANGELRLCQSRKLTRQTTWCRRIVT